MKEQSEQREGDSVVGHYSLLEPDGTTRTVHYTADPHNGFNAVVEKSGHAVHPAAPIVAHAAPIVAHAAPIATIAHAAPVATYAHAAPLVSYGHAAPALSLGGYGYGYHSSKA